MKQPYKTRINQMSIEILLLLVYQKHHDYVLGYTMRNAITRMDFGGWDITQYLAKLLSEKGLCFSTPCK